MRPNRWSKCLLLFALLALFPLACSHDNPTQSKDGHPPGDHTSGSPPAFLAGIWALEDSVVACDPFAPVWPLSHSMDTIAPGGPDFAFENAWSAWRMYNDLFGLEHDVTLSSCLGKISDTLIDVTCYGKGEYFYDYTGEICHYLLTIHTLGRPNADKWRLNRAITWSYIGEPCGGVDSDTFDVCQAYMTTLSRVGDVPDQLGKLSDNSIGHP